MAVMTSSPIVRVLNEDVHHYHRWCTPSILPPGVAERLRERWFFYTWDERSGEVRWMCSWDTTGEEVDAFAAAVAEEVAALV